MLCSLLRRPRRAPPLLVALVAMLTLLPAVAWAQAADSTNTVPSGIYESSGRFKIAPQPVIQVGKDSVTGFLCLVGFDATCVGPSGGGSGSIAATASALAPTYTPGSQALSLTLTGGLRGTLQDINGNLISFSDARQVDQVINSATLNAAVGPLLDGGMGALTYAVTGLTASGATLVHECSSNVGAASPVYFAATSAVGLSTFTADGNMRFDVAGRTACRLRVSVVGTGNITISYSASTAQVPSPVALSSGALTQLVQADTSAFLNMTTATTTTLVAGVAGKRTFITHHRYMANGTTTEKLITGTNANCAAGAADITETNDLTAQVGFSQGNGLGPIIIAGTGLYVCAVNGQTVNLHEGVAFTQQP